MSKRRPVDGLYAALFRLLVERHLPSPCEYCGRMQVELVTSQGPREYCLPCSDPIAPFDAPLVPVTWPQKRIWRIRSTYSAYTRATRHLEPEDFPIPKGRAPRFLIPVVQKRVKTRAGGRPQALKKKDHLEKLRWVIKQDQSGLTVVALAKAFGVSERTMRTFMKEHGLKLKKRPARRS
jgi:hypothetical protein